MASLKKSGLKRTTHTAAQVGSCLNEIINIKLQVGVAKNVSYLKFEEINQRFKLLGSPVKKVVSKEEEQRIQEEAERRKHKRKCLRSPRDLLIQHTKSELNNVNEKLKK